MLCGGPAALADARSLRDPIEESYTESKLAADLLRRVHARQREKDGGAERAWGERGQRALDMLSRLHIDKTRKSRKLALASVLPALPLLDKSMHCSWKHLAFTAVQIFFIRLSGLC